VGPKVSSTTPSLCSTTVDLLRLTWESVGPHLTHLTRLCLDLGHYPRPFRTAEIVTISKPGMPRAALATTKGWRPISLLSVLGKGVERLVARRFAREALARDVFAEGQASPVPGRSATDLLASIIHDAELALGKGLKYGILTIDVQGAFPSVRRNRLLSRLSSERWPRRMINFVGSFHDDRTVKLRLDGSVRPSLGLPQGSPLSPVLYALYMADVARLPGTLNYVDDIAMCVTGPDHATVKAGLQEAYRKTSGWLATWGQSVDPCKCKFTVLDRSRNPEAGTMVLDGVGMVEAKPHLKWLGVVFDRKLTF